MSLRPSTGPRMETKVYVGTGGWASNEPPYHMLARYSRLFNFAEVNSTFYALPPLERVKAWRRSVPPSFAFTVKCNRIITHEERLRPSARALACLERMLEVCGELRARALLLQTPSSLPLDGPALSGLRELASTVGRKVALALDPGGRTMRPLAAQAIEVLRELGIVHAVDLLRELPSYAHELLYARLFGFGVRQEALQELRARLRALSPREAYFSFHYLNMVRPARAFLSLLRKEGAQAQAVGTRLLNPPCHLAL
ncbi:MAG: hypothetical protein C4339_01300 [Nitrososphaerota archaeon]